MKIAVSSTGPTLDDTLDGRFGRCPYFLIIDPDTLEFDALPNPNVSQSGGAGIQAAQQMAEKGVTAVLTGNCGPNALKVIEAAGILLISGVAGTVRQAVQQYTSGSLARTSAPSVHNQPGMGMGRGRGCGRGMGRGRGMGGGGRAM
ncbi:MAG: NifB/NifX family molybdenum-iron cluster-binding protein [Desulfobacterales bacterium]|jgi:predicted Fe-Mo cluster-binding NifX family protein